MSRASCVVPNSKRTAIVAIGTPRDVLFFVLFVLFCFLSQLLSLPVVKNRAQAMPTSSSAAMTTRITRATSDGEQLYAAVQRAERDDALADFMRSLTTFALSFVCRCWCILLVMTMFVLVSS